MLGEPVAQGAVELLVVAARVGVGGHPPADVDVAAEQILAQLGAAPIG